MTAEEYEARIAELQRLILAMGDKLLTVAEHLGRLAERKECRGATIISDRREE